MRGAAAPGADGPGADEPGAAAQAAQAAIGNVLAFGAGEDAYHNKFLIFLAVAAFVSVVVCITKFGGCLEGRGSEGAQKLVVILVGTVSGVVTIPLYHHLLSALDCDIDHHDLSTFPRKSPRRCAANARASARYQRHLAFEPT